MAMNLFHATVIRAYVDETGKLLIRLRSDKLPADEWHTVAPGTPGATSFLAIALTCITSGLPCEAGIDAGSAEYSDLRRIEIVRA
jgi:hypothetical protein